MPVLEGHVWRPAKEHFPLSLAACCESCEAVFEMQPVCPACTSGRVRSVEVYCGGQRDRRQRADFVARVEGEMHALVRECRP